MARRQKKTDDVALWDMGTVAEVPLDKSVEGKSARKRRLMLWYVKGACVLLPIALFGSVTGWMEASDTQPAVEAPAISSPAKGAAMKAVDAWLATKPAPVPGGKVQSWDGFKKLETVVLEDGKPSPTYEVHALTIVSSTGHLYTTSIQMAYSDTSGVQVAGEPSLMPYAPEGTSTTVATWPGKESITAPETVKDAVEVWASAYTSGNPSTLRQTVGDPEQAHAYVPLSGIKSIKNVTVVDTAGKPTDSEAANNVKNTETIVSRVTFEVLWVGQTVSNAQSTSKVTYDLLINKANTGSPVVVAWGGPGEGFDLAPFSNALTGREIVTDEDLAKQLEEEAKAKAEATSTQPAAAPNETAPDATASVKDSE